MAVDARELPDLDRQHVYQLWTVHDGSMVSAAVLTDGTTGAAMGLPAADTQVAVTIEPAGGSEQPTGRADRARSTRSAVWARRAG